jgi:hypothetical protein
MVLDVQVWFSDQVVDNILKAHAGPAFHVQDPLTGR